MKKLYLLFLMLLIMFIPVTHSIAIYQLDQPVSELDNYTLREVFENRNIAMPDLTFKTEISPGVYRLYSINGITIDYNLINGEYEINGTASNIVEYTILNIEVDTQYHISYYAITGTLSAGGMSIYINPLAQDVIVQSNQNIDKSITFITTTQNAFRFYISSGGIYDNFTFKLQLEKGSQATPYQVPTNGPYSNIDVGIFNLTSQQIQTYYNLYLEAVRFEQENIEARQDEGGYQNIFKSILDGVKNLMQEMGNVWNFLNAPIITNDMQNYQPPAIDWSWDIIGVVRQIINNANTLAFQLLFVVPSLIYSLLGIPIHISLLSLLFSNLIFLLLGWIVVKSFII